MATDVATGVACSMLSEIGGRLITKTGRQIGYFINYNNNIENFKKQAEKLKLKLEGVQLTVDTAKRNGDDILPEIEGWLGSVDKLLKETTSFFEHEVQENKGCLYGWCPNVKAWYSLSRRAHKMTLEVTELKNQGDGFKKISERARPMGIEFISTGNFRSFQSRERITQEVKDIVKSGDFHMIGICGLGGVGKTTLINEVGKWDVGIWIASKTDHFKMMMIDGGWWPDAACEHIKCISVRSSEITELPSGGLNFPELDILHMSCNRLSIEKLNAGNMLEGMNKLKVLSMFSMSISSLPSSLRLLTNLRVLNLEYILWLRDVCSIPEELVNLEILSLRGCVSIKNVPRKMGRLTNLRVLDMRGCRVKSISPGIISSMCRLEELYTESWLWDEEGNASLNELESLRNLTILMTGIRCSKFLPKDLVFEKLKRYCIKFGSDDFENYGNYVRRYIGDIIRDISNYPFVEKALFLCLNDGTEAPIQLCGIGKLLKESAKRVWLKGDELVIALDELAAGGFRHLKKLRIQDCDNKVVEYVANYNSTAEEWVNGPNSSYGVFTKLETLELDNMSHLKAIVSCCHDGKPGGGFFGNLKEIKLSTLPELTHLWKHNPTIHPQACAIKLSSLQFIQLKYCKNVKYLFTQSEAASLENLETLEIDNCEKMEAVILDNLGPTNNNVIMLPNLKRLKLSFLRSLICFGNVIEFPQLRGLELSFLRKHAYVQSIFNQKAMFPSLERLALEGMESKELWGSQDPPIFFRKLKYLSVKWFTTIVNIIPSNSAQFFSGLMQLQVQYCPLLEEVFESTGVNIGGADADHLHLFTNLTFMQVICCDRLKSLFSSYVARNLPNLNRLVISECGSMEEVIGKEEGVEEDGRIGETIFPELRTLGLYHLPRLKRLCPVNSHLKLPDRLQIDVMNCPKLTE